ncbi:uncharacterized protein N7515_002656 [Penicillium bovifimosum]|uniref:Uncharacterized protein n=1 Tax=Penicillium bovifimosum TaxID=126998 RepID=A0A9W9HCC6_9EURO|nr:uncharacterized protein N7515_002656 [Penicillium bovifimosum]KAJ5143869.1 hypothetical protein N7515_002656 [Penicillium bovifimosum]
MPELLCQPSDVELRSDSMISSVEPEVLNGIMIVVIDVPFLYHRNAQSFCAIDVSEVQQIVTLEKMECDVPVRYVFPDASQDWINRIASSQLLGVDGVDLQYCRVKHDLIVINDPF